MSTQEEKPKQQPKEEQTRRCGRVMCGNTGTGYQKCSRCKTTYYCTKKCQIADWKENHKYKCEEWKPSGREKISEQVVYDYVECETYEQCRDHLIKHPELINRELSDEMFEKGYFALAEHPPEIGIRFIRNCQIINYLLDIKKASGGQQDIALFFGKLLDPQDPTHLKNFTLEYMGSAKRILARHKERAAKKMEKEKGVQNEKKTEAPSTDSTPKNTQEDQKKQDSKVEELD